MRISDWSSDVCSSDLPGDIVGLDVDGEAVEARREAADAVDLVRVHEHALLEGAGDVGAAVQRVGGVAVEIPPAFEAEAFVNVDFRRPSGGGDQPEGGPGTALVGHFGGEFILAVADLDRAGVVARSDEHTSE